MEISKEPRFRRTLATLGAKASSRPKLSLGSQEGQRWHTDDLQGDQPELGPCFWWRHLHAVHTERRCRETGRAGSWASGLQEQEAPPAVAARLARAARGSLQLLWVGSRDLQKIRLLQCGTSSTPFPERAREGDVRAESTAPCCSHRTLHPRLQRNRKRSACEGHSEGSRRSQRKEGAAVLKRAPSPIARQRGTPQDAAREAKAKARG